MSDSGAIPSPTVITLPVRPRAASASRNGVRAASSGVRPSRSGMRVVAEAVQAHVEQLRFIGRSS